MTLLESGQVHLRSLLHGLVVLITTIFTKLGLLIEDNDVKPWDSRPRGVQGQKMIDLVEI